MHEPETLRLIDRNCVLAGGRKLSYFSGCDYFRLASHRLVLQAARHALKESGLNVSASRLTTGNHPAYLRLEKALADFFAMPSATLLPAGYLAGIAVGQALAGTFSHALLDERAHPALRETVAALNCPVLSFQHRDVPDLQRSVVRCGQGARVVLLTDGMFAFDGSTAPMKEYLQILPKDGLLIVDDAHAGGVLGENGRGTPEHCQVKDPRIVQLITLSKAFGVFGGAVLGQERLRRAILERSRIFVGTTPMPLPLVQASLESLRILKRNGVKYRKRLTENLDYVRSRLEKANLSVPHFPGPIIPVITRNTLAASRFKTALLNAGIYPPFIKYPGGPSAGIFRFAISSEHTPRQLRKLVSTLLANRCFLEP